MLIVTLPSISVCPVPLIVFWISPPVNIKVPALFTVPAIPFAFEVIVAPSAFTIAPVITPVDVFSNEPELLVKPPVIVALLVISPVFVISDVTSAFTIKVPD